MSPFESRFNQFLATGEYVATEDAKPRRVYPWKPDPEKFLKNLLSQHDKRFHPNGFNPETDTCTFREQLDKTNNIDDLSAAEKMESEKKHSETNEYKVGDKVKEVISGESGTVTEVSMSGNMFKVLWDDGISTWKLPDDLSAAEKREAEEKNATFKEGDKVQDPESGGFGKVTDVSGTRIRVSWDNGNSTWESADKITLSGESATPLGDPERGRQAIIDGPGAGYLATLEREVAAGKTEGLEGEKKRCRHYIENGKDDAEKQLHRDALAFLEELGKKAEQKNTPASKAFEPPFDMDKEGLYGYGKTDPSAKDAATLAATFNQRAECGFSDDEVQAYFDAFKDMDAGKVPKLPDLDGKTYEPPMDTKWNGPQQALAAIFQKRPDLIRPYIVERLEDANFHSEVKELRSGAYKKRTKPYNSEEEYKKRQRRQMAQDAAAVKYLKEC